MRKVLLYACFGSLLKKGMLLLFHNPWCLTRLYAMGCVCSSILSIGQWSDRGCNRSESLSNTSVTVCECDHLTHFAILLSASPLNLTQEVTLSLEIIGYVGVSISLVAMALTITTFTILKYDYHHPSLGFLLPLNFIGHSTTCVTTSTLTSASASG